MGTTSPPYPGPGGGFSRVYGTDGRSSTDRNQTTRVQCWCSPPPGVEEAGRLPQRYVLFPADLVEEGLGGLLGAHME